MLIITVEVHADAIYGAEKGGSNDGETDNE